MKHEYTVETIIQFAVEIEQKGHTLTYIYISLMQEDNGHMNISHENLCYMQILCKETVILCEHRVTNIHVHL